MNKKGIEVLGYTKDTQYEGSVLEQDKNGNLTGLMFAKETPKAIYMTLGLTTKLTPEERINSSLQFNREFNRFGLKSVIDAAGESQNFPTDYGTSMELAKTGQIKS